jgi:hypothetical protein
MLAPSSGRPRSEEESAPTPCALRSIAYAPEESDHLREGRRMKDPFSGGGAPLTPMLTARREDPFGQRIAVLFNGSSQGDRMTYTLVLLSLLGRTKCQRPDQAAAGASIA